MIRPRGERDFEVLVQIVEAEGKAGVSGTRERAGEVLLGSQWVNKRSGFDHRYEVMLGIGFFEKKKKKTEKCQTKNQISIINIKGIISHLSSLKSFAPYPIHPRPVLNLNRTVGHPRSNKHLFFVTTHSLPLLQQHGDFVSNVLHNEIHLDIVAIMTKRILELTPNAVDTVERERDQHDDQHRPPAHVVHEREWQDAAKEREHLFLVDPARGGLSSEP